MTAGACSYCSYHVGHAPGCPFSTTRYVDPIPSWNVGWRCPNCGAGNAPSTARCACVPPPPVTFTC